jgi:hypothetical protein
VREERLGVLQRLRKVIDDMLASRRWLIGDRLFTPIFARLAAIPNRSQPAFRFAVGNGGLRRRSK